MKGNEINSYVIHKINLKLTEDLNVTLEPVKFLQENIGKSSVTSVSSMISWTQNQKHKEQKQRQTDEITSI